MKKITSKLLCIPPFISTAWENIKSLHFSTDTDTPSLIVTLSSGTEIKIPNLPAETLEDIFKTHTEHLESSKESTSAPKLTDEKPQNTAKAPIFSFDLPFNFDGFGDMSTLMSSAQHDMKLSNSEPLPPELLEKVIKMAANMGLDLSKIEHLKAEPHCNCPHCQVVRAVQEGNQPNPDAPDLDEEVTESDLTFKEWDIKSIGDKLYEVANPLDPSEKYQVFLGNPVGCTCGKPHCEHLKAVLKS